MISSTTGDWLKSGDQYSDQQINSVLSEIGVEIVGETDAVFLALCPFHRNTDTPSFAVNKENGSYICFSPSCDVKGSLVGLVQSLADLTIFPAKRLIARFYGGGKTTAERVEDIFAKKNELPSFPQDIINRMTDEFWGSPAADYMHGRGFTDETLAHFSIGYSKGKGLVVVPVHNWEGDPVGVIGRTITGKRFENSEKLPTKKTMFNLHRAKRVGEKIIVVESAFDAMRIHQAGFPNVVATCGGFFTEHHQQLLNRHFNEIIIMTDNDDPDEHRTPLCRKCPNTCQGHNPGRVLGDKIQESLRNKRIRWASYDYGIIYPHGAKDAGDLTEEEIAQCINNSIGAAEMVIWRRNIEELSIV